MRQVFLTWDNTAFTSPEDEQSFLEQVIEHYARKASLDDCMISYLPSQYSTIRVSCLFIKRSHTHTMNDGPYYSNAVGVLDR